MKKKKKSAYVKILQGMNCCYGSDDRRCSDCPYDRYNERDFYGMGTSYCMEKLNSDAKKWTESMTMFTTCQDCVCWWKDHDENEALRYDWEGKWGRCSQWGVVTGHDEYCSRGAVKD